MRTRFLKDIKEFKAGDDSILREILHPDKGNFDIRYSLAHAKVKTKKSTRLHRIKKASEVYYIIEGSGIMYINGKKFKVKAGCTIYIPPGSAQCIKNTGNRDLKFLCIVDPAWRRGREEMIK